MFAHFLDLFSRNHMNFLPKVLNFIQTSGCSSPRRSLICQLQRRIAVYVYASIWKNFDFVRDERPAIFAVLVERHIYILVLSVRGGTWCKVVLSMWNLLISLIIRTLFKQFDRVFVPLGLISPISCHNFGASSSASLAPTTSSSSTVRIKVGSCSCCAASLPRLTTSTLLDIHRIYL